MPLLTVSNDGTNDSDIEISGTIPSHPLYLQLINFYFDNSESTKDVGSTIAVADEIKRLVVDEYDIMTPIHFKRSWKEYQQTKRWLALED